MGESRLTLVQTDVLVSRASLSSATEISRPFASQEDFDDNLEAE
jgi:hypothetical protein